MVFNLSDHNSVVAQFLFELREVSIQKDRARFRKNVERIGQIMAYEISKKLPFDRVEVVTPVSRTSVSKLEQMPLLITILRAGLPFLQGFLDYFDQSDTGFVGAYRVESSDEIKIKMDYVSTPSLLGRQVILCDPMLATGKSAVNTIKHLMKNATPQKIYVASVLAAPAGIDLLLEFSRELSCPLEIWTGAIDEGLNDKFYIVPGLGDAGDLSFGTK
jgi:uracil phosphoribosyltransferase